MAVVVAVHGIAQQLGGSASAAAAWRPAMCDGIAHAGGAAWALSEADVAVAHWGLLVRQSATKSAGSDTGELSDLEVELLLRWWEELEATEGLPGPGQTDKGAPQLVQRALKRLSQSRFFARVGDRALLGNLRQVRRYFTEDELRAQVAARLADVVSDDTRVLVGHSLGSVIAYEGLAANPSWPVRHLITLGSPLGIPNVVFDRLRPRPVSGRGAWPAGLLTWTNVAAREDPVALRKDLAELFPGDGRQVQDHLISNETQAHDVGPYLSAVETGTAMRAAISHV